MAKMAPWQFHSHLLGYIESHPSQRHGQAAFNLMAELYPGEARKFTGTAFDPFYNDSRVDAFVRACLGE